jgi:hypothetical protein
MERTKPPKGTLQTFTPQQLAVMSDIVGRATFAARLGLQYGGDRTIYQALGYPDEILFEDYAARYKRQDIARAIINRPISKTWKGPVKITEPGDEDTKLEKAYKKLEKELKLKSKFVRLDKLSSIGEYGVLLLGFNDVTKKDDWQLPADVGKKKLNFVKPLSQGSATIKTWMTQTRSPRYGMPLMYEVEFTNPGADSTTSLLAHYTRVLHVAPELMESEVEGTPPLESVYNRLMDLEKLVGGSAEMFWRGARPGYQAKTKEGYTMGTTTEAGLQAQIDEYENNLRRMIVNQGVEFEALDQQVSDPSKHVDVIIQMISAETGIPKRILTGSERGELASSQDETGWLSLIQERREEHAEPNIVRPFVDMCIERGILPPPVSEEEGYDVEWQDLFSPSDKEKADVGKIRADALAVYANNPTASLIVPPEAFFEWFLGLNEEQRDKLKEMSEDALAEELLAIREGQNDPPEPEEEEEDENEGQETQPMQRTR